jgi:DNA-binding Xre family transcriptional regulator
LERNVRRIKCIFDENEKGGNVTTDVLLKICNALKCNTDDIMEVVPDEIVKE